MSACISPLYTCQVRPGLNVFAQRPCKPPSALTSSFTIHACQPPLFKSSTPPHTCCRGQRPAVWACAGPPGHASLPLAACMLPSPCAAAAPRLDLLARRPPSTCGMVRGGSMKAPGRVVSLHDKISPAQPDSPPQARVSLHHPACLASSATARPLSPHAARPLDLQMGGGPSRQQAVNSQCHYIPPARDSPIRRGCHRQHC